MKHSLKTLYTLMALLVITGCAPKAVNYDLPSAGTTKAPKWVATHRAVRDTIFIVIHLPEQGKLDMDKSVQKAQSELHTLLVRELETMLRDYWDVKQLNYSDDEKFQLLSGLPLTLEQIMNHVVVTDGWERNGEVSILCAMDYEEISAVLMEDMEIDDRSFLPFLKRRMDDLAERHR